MGPVAEFGLDGAWEGRLAYRAINNYLPGLTTGFDDSIRMIA